MSPKILRVKEAAEILQCSSETIRRLTKRGALKAHRNFLGHRIFSLNDLLKAQAERQEVHD